MRKDINGNKVGKYDCFAYRKYSGAVLSEDGKIVFIREKLDETREYLSLMSSLGNIDAQYLYGRFLLHVDNNEDEALSWLNKAAEKGSCYAEYFLSKLNYDETGEALLDYLQDAVQQGHPSSTYEIAIGLLNMDDYAEKGLVLLKLAANCNHPLAQLKLAKMYLTGCALLEKDWLEARLWFQRAAQNGNSEAENWCLDNDAAKEFVENGIIRQLKANYC